MPGALQYGNVEERIARTVPQLNEPETFLRIEPFDGGIYRWARRGRVGVL